MTFDLGSSEEHARRRDRDAPHRHHHRRRLPTAHNWTTATSFIIFSIVISCTAANVHYEIFNVCKLSGPTPPMIFDLCIYARRWWCTYLLHDKNWTTLPHHRPVLYCNANIGVSPCIIIYVPITWYIYFIWCRPVACCDLWSTYYVPNSTSDIVLIDRIRVHYHCTPHHVIKYVHIYISI